MRKIIYAKWLDHTSDVDMEWAGIADISSLEPAVIETIGFLIEENEMYITIGMSITTIDNEDSVSGRYTIIKGNIIEYMELQGEVEKDSG